MTPYYQDESVTLYHGDCREILPSLPKADLVITDPPYRIAYGGDRGFMHRRPYWQKIRGVMDQGFDMALLHQFDNWFCFCGKEQLPEMFRTIEGKRWMLLTWNKTNPTPLINGTYLPDAEYIMHCYAKGRLFGGYKEKSRFIVLPIRKHGFDHPCVKPVSIIAKLLKLGSQPGELILDPFAGTGTTMFAARELGRRAIGVELEEKYCEIAATRLREVAA